MTIEESLVPLTPNQRAFIAAYMQCAQITRSAQAADVSLQAHYSWLKESDNYAEAFNLARPIAIARLEEEAIRRAYEGVDEPVFYKGDECGVIRRYSDSLMQTLLKGHMPEKYRERSDTILKNPDGSSLFNKFEVVFLDRKDRES